MAEYLVNSGSGATEMAVSTAYALGARVVINRSATGSYYNDALAYVWECTTAGTTDVSLPASYPSSYTPDTTTFTSGTAVFTCRNPGYSSGTTKDWTFATIFLSYATRRAVADGDVVKVHKLHSESWATGNAFIAIRASIYINCVDKDNNDARSTMGTANFVSSAYSVYIQHDNGTKKVLFYGISFKCGNGGGNANRIICVYTGGEYNYDQCRFWVYDTYSAGWDSIKIGGGNASSASYKGCVFRIDSSTGWLGSGYTRIDIEGCSIDGTTAVPSTMFVGFGAACRISGCDFSNTGISTLCGDQTNSGCSFEISNCKLPSGVTALAAQTYPKCAEVRLFNCASGDTHYNFGYYDSSGSVESVVSIYANDGALYDGTNHVTWKITTTASCSAAAPFRSPWIEKYNAVLSAITPSLEILRDGSTTAYTDAEVWGEFAYQGTTGTTLDSVVDDRMEYPPSTITSAANQAAGVGLTGWTGEAASAWSGKLAPASAITPAVIGMLRARVGVAAPSVTVYVDPKIR